MSGASVEFGDVLTAKLAMLLKRETCEFYSLNWKWQSGGYLKLQFRGPPPPSAGSGFRANFGSGLGIRIQQAGNKQLVPVGITDWLNFTLSGGNGPGRPYRVETHHAVSVGDFNASAALVVDYAPVMERFAGRKGAYHDAFVTQFACADNLTLSRQTDKPARLCTINNGGETLEVRFW